MFNDTINILPPSQVIQQCPDMVQIDQAYGMHNVVTGLFYQKIIANLYWFFMIGTVLLNLAFIFYYRQKENRPVLANLILSVSFLFLIGSNAMIIFLRTFAFGDDIVQLIPYLILWFINFLMLFYNFMKFFMPLGVEVLKKMWEGIHGKETKK